MSRIGVIGSGYVGLTTSACFAALGHAVACVDIDPERVAALCDGRVPFYEPALPGLVRAGLASGALHFSERHTDAVADVDYVFVAVNTPSAPDGSADLQYLWSALAHVAAALPADAAPVVVLKSTVPVGTAERAAAWFPRVLGRPIPVIANPEFLREGTAVADCFAPDRVVVGGDDAGAIDAVADLYAFAGCPVVRCDWASAEMIKYAANAFLATRISFINEMAAIAEAVGADIGRVAEGMGLDPRIGRSYFRPGLGFGGSCLPKDVRALAHMGAAGGVDARLLPAVLEINEGQRRAVVERLAEALGGLDGRVIALLGLAFKPETDDVREAPALDLIAHLRQAGATVRVFDPAAAPRVLAEAPDLTAAADPYAAAGGADAVVLVTEWEPCVQLDFARMAAAMRGDLLLDGRHAWDAAAVRDAGLRYTATGARPVRCPVQPSTPSADHP